MTEYSENRQIQITDRPFVGVFDSGLGGISVLADLIKKMPGVNFEYFGDSANAPYGTKDHDFIWERSHEICSDFVYRGASAVVIACNTATSVAVKRLRELYSIPIVGMEPAVKPALTVVQKYGEMSKIAVLATPMTLNEEKYRGLVRELQAEERVIEIPSPELVELVEKHFFDEEKVRRVISAFSRTKVDPFEEVGAIVLGCTHFVFLKKYFQEIYEDLEIIDGNIGTAKRLQSLLSADPRWERWIQPDSSVFQKGEVRIRNSSGDSKIELSKKLLKYRMMNEDYTFVESQLSHFIETRLSGAEAQFAELFYIEKETLVNIANKMGLKEQVLLQMKEKLGNQVFKYLKR